MDRKIQFLTRQKIIYRRNPITDVPTEVYDWGCYYKEGTYQCYNLFNSKSKITTYKSFKWHLLTIWYLNPELEKESMLSIAMYMKDKANGFTTFDIDDYVVDRIIEEVYLEPLDDPPKNRIRKIIFKDNCGLTLSEKMSIVGKMTGKSKRITDEAIYDCMLYLSSSNTRITYSKIAKILQCTTRTLHRNMKEELKTEKELLNKDL